jgi:hypothetical protein
MLASGKLTGFVPTADYDKARAFYEGKLGFEFVSLDQFALVVSVGGHNIRIAKVPNFAPLPATILGWEVDDIVLSRDGSRSAAWSSKNIRSLRIANSVFGPRRVATGSRGSRIQTEIFSPCLSTLSDGGCGDRFGTCARRSANSSYLYLPIADSCIQQKSFLWPV